MFIRLTSDVDHLRLRAKVGFVGSIMDDFGQELIDRGEAVEISEEAFDAAWRASTAGATL